MSDPLGELWTCPECGAKFVNKNQWHSCGQATLDDWLEGKGDRARALFDRFAGLIGACGPYHVAPAKTRIAFMARVRFAAITKLTDEVMVCGFALPYALESPRFLGVEEVVPGWFQHRMRVEDPDELDDEVQRWVRTAYELMGMQGRLDDDAAPPA